MSDLHATIKQDMIKAMKAQERLRLETIRMLLAAIKQREVDSRAELKDAEILSVVQKMIKQRQDSMQQFTAGNRPDLAQKEQQELAILQDYLPAQLSDEEVVAAIDAAILALNAASMKDMGRVMAMLGDTLKGQADMAVVSQLVKTHLA